MTQTTDGLNNPVRLSLRDRTIDVSDLLRGDEVHRVVDEIDTRPSEGNIYIHWEVADE